MKKNCFRLFLGVMVMVCMVSLSFAAQDTGTETTAPVKSAKKKKPFPAQENLLDINTATVEQLKALPGLTDEDVKKIIVGRPYTRKNQLKQKNIVTASTYDGIKSAIVAKKPAK